MHIGLFRVSTHRYLNILAILACMDAYLGYKLHIFVWKLLHLSLEMWYMGTYPGVGTCLGYYGTCKATRTCK